MSLQTLLIALGVAAALLLVVWRFTSGRYGTLRPSKKATADYESFLVNPELRYYISGPDLYPNAVMGMARVWALDSDLWKQRDLESKGMRELVVNMQANAGQSLASLHGFDILDDKGSRIGTWYSLPGLDVMIRITGENRVIVSTPSEDVSPAR